jgi:5-oxoprolinase (ATP-hydrolysing) subunit C
VSLKVERAGPALSVQDGGREGLLGLGLSRGGAADRDAWLEGLALLGLPPGTASIEMAGVGGRFLVEAATRFALTGAEMKAKLDGVPLEWGAGHVAIAGSFIDIGAAVSGVYGYLTIAGGIATEPELGGRGFHGIAGLGRPLRDGDRLPLASDPTPNAPPMRLSGRSRSASPLRVMPGPQTASFPDEVRAAFEAATFTRSPRANRQGVKLDHEGAPFATGGQLTLVSDFIAEGDIQMTGDGAPYVLLADCQTMGGYPRIGTVLPADLSRIAQAGPGEALRFRFVTVDEATAAWESDETVLARLKRGLLPRVRDPREMSDLLSYDLVDRPPRDVIGE